MKIQSVTFKNFSKGEHTDEDLAYQGFAKTIRGVDIYGTGAGTFTDCPHRSGIYMPSQEMVAETLGAVSAGNEVSAMPEWIQPFGTKTFGLTNNGNLVVTESVPATNSTQTWYRVSAVSATTGGGGLMPFGTNLYYGQDSVLGQTDGTATDNNFETFKENSATPRPMVVMGDELVIGNGQYIATLDSDETTFNDDKLQKLPTGFKVRSMDIWNSMVAIVMDFTPAGATNPSRSKLLLWDGISPGLINNLNLPFAAAPLIAAHDNLLWMFGDDGALNGTIYVFNGAQLEKMFFLPGTVFHKLGSKAQFQSNLLVGTNGRITSDNGGILTIGRESGTTSYGLSLSHLKSGESNVSAVNIGGLYGESNNILAAYQDGASSYGIDRSDNDQFPDSGVVLQTLPLHLGFPELKKTFLSIKMDVDKAGVATGSTLQVLYRIDSSTAAFTALKTISESDTDLNVLIPIRKRGRRIELQLKWVTTSNAPLLLRSFTVYFAASGKSR